MLKDGTIYFAETGINEHPKKAGFLGLWLVEKQKIDTIKQELEQSNISLLSVETDDIEVKETTNIIEDKSRIFDAAQIIAEHSRTDGLSLKNKIPALKEAVDAISQADIIVYSVTSLESNMGSALVVEGIQEAIKKNTKAVKLYLANPTVENDPVINGKFPTALDMLNRLYRYVSNQPAYRSSLINYDYIDQYLDYIAGIGKEYGYKPQTYILSKGEEVKPKGYIPFNAKDIAVHTQNKVIPIELDIELPTPIAKQKPDYSGTQLEFGIYSPYIIKELIIALGLLNREGYRVREGKVKKEFLAVSEIVQYLKGKSEQLYEIILVFKAGKYGIFQYKISLPEFKENSILFDKAVRLLAALVYQRIVTFNPPRVDIYIGKQLKVLARKTKEAILKDKGNLEKGIMEGRDEIFNIVERINKEEFNITIKDISSLSVYSSRAVSIDKRKVQQRLAYAKIFAGVVVGIDIGGSGAKVLVQESDTPQRTFLKWRQRWGAVDENDEYAELTKNREVLIPLIDFSLALASLEKHSIKINTLLRISRRESDY